MTMESVNLFGRDVIPITTMQGQRNYYDHMNYWRSCCHNTNIRILPTEEEVGEYLNLKEEKPSMFGILQNVRGIINCRHTKTTMTGVLINLVKLIL